MDGQIDNMKERQREEGEAEQERDERSEWSGGWRRAVISAGLRPHLVTKLKAFHFSSLLAASLAPHTLTLWLYFTAVEHTPSYITAQFRAALDKTRITTSVSILATFSSYIHIKSCYCSLFPQLMSQYMKCQSGSSLLKLPFRNSAYSSPHSSVELSAVCQPVDAVNGHQLDSLRGVALQSRHSSYSLCFTPTVISLSELKASLNWYV